MQDENYIKKTKRRLGQDLVNKRVLYNNVWCYEEKFVCTVIVSIPVWHFLPEYPLYGLLAETHVSTV